ncbi:MAG: HNH endonuclease [Deltaproteobacteria bacterium]|nr:HNH endonuclease [Deltaproteobacteria bacterium]
MINIDARVLVLNRNYQPVSITGVERAFGLLYAGAARALDEAFNSFDYDTWAELGAELGEDVVHTPRLALKIPRVVVLQAYSRIPRVQVRFSRQNIYLRDKFTCQYCYKHFQRHHLNLDHVVPRSQGGRSSWENIVCSCVKCNLKKGGRTPAEANMQLLTQPKRPTWSSLTPFMGRAPYKEWLPFLDPVAASYWNTELESE